MTDQWFIKIKPLAEPAIDVVKKGLVQFQPKEWENVYFAWMNDIRDWNISRQQWWGHQIPAWYTEDGQLVVARNEAEARQKADLAADCELTRDPDVLDTWFSSALWTFGTLGWPDETPDLAEFHPTSVLVTGHDIIFFWVARMIMMTLKFVGEVPFKTVYITGLIRDAMGQKMSKTKGNGLDPLDVIDGISLDELVKKRTKNLPQPRLAARIQKQTKKDFPDGIASFGTDALRLTFASMASPSRNYTFDLKQVESYHNFCNKLWNATRFVVEQLQEGEPLAIKKVQSFPEVWIRSRVDRLIRATRRAIETYRFDLYAQTLYATVWHEYCDWYLEFSKIVLWNQEADPAEIAATKHTLLEILETLLRVAHPIMPYVTEVLWLKLKPFHTAETSSLLTTEFPSPASEHEDTDTNATMEWLMQLIMAIRTIRGERNIPPNRDVPIYLLDGTGKDSSHLEICSNYIHRLARVSDIHWWEGDQRPPLGSMEVLDNLKVLVPFLDQQEIDREQSRLNKEIDRLTKTLKQSEGKLQNNNFIVRAPAEVVEKERSKYASTQLELKALKAQAERLSQNL